jgi:dTDP-4-amino-4,6-dideoxygalactose transaminase
MIPVTKPFLPPLDEYNELLVGIWQRQWLTNMGPLASSLEVKLKEFLELHHLLFVTNGTVALQMAIKALDLKGEIITTPFSFVATTSCIVWENCKPVFVDIEENSLNIDATKIEASITERTSAILATHVYGNPCDVVAIEEIAKKHNLKIIYDAAHAFGVKVNGKSIFEFGDITTCSLHATKLFHSGEGGLVVTKNAELLKKTCFYQEFWNIRF